MKYTCLIVDDEDLARELIATHLSNLPDFTVVASCNSALEARKILQSNQVDLIFMDIEMPLLKGTAFVKSLQVRPSVIFTTAYRDYAIEGFELSAVDYLLKPITFVRFLKAIDKFIDSQSKKPSILESDIQQKVNHLFVTKDRKQVKLILSEIRFVESLKDYIKIHLENEVFTIKSTLQRFHDQLDERFVRIHRSYVVNMDQVTAYSKHDVEIGEREIPIGDTFKLPVTQYFSK